jgi:hypothetical protein
MADFPLIEQASLAMVAGAYKEGKIYSQLPTDGSGDFTFTRGTDTATRVNKDGYIEKERGNLLEQSNTFDTTWVLNYTSVTSGQSGYDGSNDAWLLNSTTTGYPRIEQTKSASGIFTLSVYAKPATDGFLLIRTFGADTQVWFNLNNGTISNLTGVQYVSSRIESVGNGWYRCSVVANGSLTSLRFYPASAYGVYSTSGNGIYIQDAQLEQGLVATDYIETTTAPVYAGLTDNMPRLDYSGGAECGAYLLEPGRTNKVTSILFNNLNGASYTVSQTEIGIGMPLQHFTKTSSGAYAAHILSNQSVSAGDIYTFSTFFKPVSSNSGFHRIGMYFNGQNDFIYYDYARNGFFEDTSGTPLPSNKYVEEYANGVYRVISIQTAVADGNRVDLNIDSYYNTNSQFLCGYAQIEQGSYPTSYIPTYGSTQTRAADVPTVSKTLPSEGSLFINVGGTSQPKLSVLGEYFDASTTANKVAIAYSSTALVISHNGSIVVNKTGTYDVSSLTQIQLGHSNGADQADSPISEFITFDSFLTNNELNALTQ